MTFLLGFIYIIVAGAVLVSMTALFLRGEKKQSNKLFFVFQGMVALWCVSQVLVLLASDKLQLSISYLIGNVGICFAGAFLYYFAVLYCGKELAGVRLYLPVSVSAFHFLCVASNPLHRMYYTEFGVEQVSHGIFFYTNVVATYCFVLAGAALLYKGLAGKGRILIVISVLLPVLLNAIYLVGLVHTNFDITPLGFACSVILVTRATAKYQFLDLKRELAITNEKLLLERERNRIAQEVHDTAGHTLTMIQSYMKLADVSLRKQENEETLEYISQARTLTSQGIRELRESINQLRKEAEYELVTQGVMQLAGRVKEIPVEVTVKGEDSKQYSHLSKLVYDTVRESITNSLKYAGASKIEIVLRFRETDIELVIGDDGKGCNVIVDNNGLSGIRERVEKAGGTVRFISSEGEGFLTRVKLPVA